MEDNIYYTTELNRMFAFLEGQANKSTDEYRIFNEYVELQKRRFEDEYTDDSRPFISIITRTRGNRPEMLTETLLCVCGQKDTDFELLVVGHNVEENNVETIKSIIDDLPLWMRKKTRYIPVEGGTRATPLNRGFEEAKGKYITILDDDDLVFDNWVEEFKKSSKESPGKILHSYSISQGWETVSIDHPNTPIAVEKPLDTFCRDYVFSRQLVFNVCPTMALAFPAYTFKVLNIRFDENLSTTEDWDFLMRTAFITGVFNNDTPTSIYRQWLNTENSRSLHNQKEWEVNYKNILKKYLDLPLFLDKPSMEQIIKPSLTHSNILDAEMFFSKGNRFSSKDNIAVIYDENEDIPYVFDLEKIGTVKSIRIDPCSNGDIEVRNLSVKVIFTDGEELDYSIDDVKTNGYRRGDSLVFLRSDPQIIIRFEDQKSVKKVYFDAVIIHPLSSVVIDELLDKNLSLFNLVRKCFSILKRMGRFFIK